MRGNRDLLSLGPDALLLQVSSESKSLVTHLRFSPDGKQLVVVCGSRVHMLDAFTGKALGVLAKQPHWLTTLLGCSACACMAGTSMPWQASEMVTLLRGLQQLHTVASPYSAMCCAAGVRKFTVTTGSEAMGPAMEPAFSPDGQYFGSGVLRTNPPSSAAA